MAEHAYTPSRPTIITRRAIGAATALLALSSAAAARAVEPASPDDGLIRLCSEVAVHRDRFNLESTLDDEECPIWAAYTATADAISNAKPQTLAGMVAKARAAKGEAIGGDDGEEGPDGTMAGRWAWDLVNDLIRLGGRT